MHGNHFHGSTLAPHPLRYQHTIAEANQVHLGHPVVMHRAGQQADCVQELSQQLVVGNGRLLAQEEGSRWGESASRSKLKLLWDLLLAIIVCALLRAQPAHPPPSPLFIAHQLVSDVGR